MKTIRNLIYLLLVFVLLALPVSAMAAASGEGLLVRNQDEFVMGGTFTLAKGETLSGNLWILGGNATIEESSRVTGDIMLLGGNVNMAGEVSGDINAMGGNIILSTQSVVRGDLNLVGGSYERRPGALIEGQVNTAPHGPFSFTLPGGAQVPAFEVSTNPLWDIVTFFFRAFVISALAVLAVMFWPKHIGRIGQTAIEQPLPSGGIGLVTAVVTPVILLVITITIILIPVTIISMVVLALMLLLGWISLGVEVGQRMAYSLKQEWALPVSAGVGTLIFTIVAAGVGEVVPCVGWVVPTLLGMVGFGAVLLTRFGTQSYPGHTSPPARPAGQLPVDSLPPESPIPPEADAPRNDLQEPAPWEIEPDEGDDQPPV